MYLSKKHLLGVLSTILLVASLSVPCLAQTTLYSQPPTYPGHPYTGYVSDDPNGQQVYDTFSLSNPADVGGITWQGFTYDSATGGNGVPGPSLFTVDFYTSSGGLPGNLIDSQTVTSFSQSLAGTSGFFSSNLPVSIYNYTAALPTNVSLAAGTPYWFSIVATTSGTSVWDWTGGPTSPTDFAYSEHGGTPVLYDGGFQAFSLTSGTAPESSAGMSFAILLAFGASLFTLGLRKRKAVTAAD